LLVVVVVAVILMALLLLSFLEAKEEVVLDIGQVLLLEMWQPKQQSLTQAVVEVGLQALLLEALAAPA